MAEIQPIDPEVRLAQLLGDDFDADPVSQISPAADKAQQVELTGNLFEDFLSRAVESLNGISQAEIYTNQLTESYLRGEVELHEVMAAQSKMNILMQLAVTTISTAVTTFKEITQMQI